MDELAMTGAGAENNGWGRPGLVGFADLYEQVRTALRAM
jgi:hypothetical protein